MGLHPRIHASDKYTMVLDSQLSGDRPVPQWDGGYDIAKDFA